MRYILEAVIDQMLLHFQQSSGPDEAMETVSIAGQELGVRCRRNARARHYLIYVRSDRSLSLTIPRRGSRREGMEFVRRRSRWIERQLEKIAATVVAPRHWTTGTEVMLYGERHALERYESSGQHYVRLGRESFLIRPGTENLRPLVEGYLRGLARRVLPPRVAELALRHGAQPKKVTVRNQSSRWGSCATSGAISLNWRLVQATPEVCDYVILHELMHLREMNHSERFWKLVEQACPDYARAELWLKQNAPRLGL